jgi:hypothetical protein
MSRKALIVVLLIGVFALSAFAVAAQDDHIFVPTDSGIRLFIDDGRLNGFDIAAPVAVYYTYTTVTDAAGSTIQSPNGIQLLQISPVTSNGSELVELTGAELAQVITGDTHSMDFNGFTLNYNPDNNWFWVVSPPDAEGKLYTFQWENTVFPRTPNTSDAIAADGLTASASAAATAEVSASATPDASATPATP